MKTPSLLLLAIATLAVASTAQTVVVPAGMDTSNPGSTTLAWRNSLFRFQMLYDTTHFLSQGINYPISITRLRYRARGGVTSFGGETYNGVTVQMSSSPSDWSNPSTTFATNVGADNTMVFNGNIVCAVAAGTSPNTYIIDIPLATPFVYDPTSGLDLCIDVDAPNAPLPSGVPSMAASSNSSHMARRISTTTAGSATGSRSYFACVVLMDYTPTPNAAAATPYGEGCVGRALTYYETFVPGVFDLQGSAGSPNSILMSPLVGGYVVTPGSNGWFSPRSTALALGDDTLSPPLGLNFPFSYPGGSTNDILVCSNGFAWLDITQTSTSARGTPEVLVEQGARLAPLWNDLDPSAGGAVYFDLDPNGTAAYVTWDLVPLFNVGTSLNTLQLAIFSNGRVEYRYQVCQTGNGLAGWSPGGGARNAGGVDISASMPFLIEPDVFPLSLMPINRPKLGTTFNLEVGNFTLASTLGAVSLGFTQYAPGISLDVIGMRSCFQNASIDGMFSFAVAGATQPFSLTIPTSTALAGLHLYVQAVANAAGSNPLGVISSNGVDLLLERN